MARTKTKRRTKKWRGSKARTVRGIEQPRFVPGTSCTRYECQYELIVDGDGRPWWVDPVNQTIKPARATR